MATADVCAHDVYTPGMLNVFRPILLAMPLLIPLVTTQWSLLDWLGWAQADTYGVIHPHPKWLELLHFLDGVTKPQVEWKFAAVLAALAYAMTLATEGTRLYLPRRRFDEFRTDLLDERRKEWVNQVGPGSNVRFNVMFVRRPGRLLWVAKRLEWVWGYGYDPPGSHQDSSLCFWCWQGVCGRAYWRQKPVFVELRTSTRPRGWRRWWCNQFRMSPGHVRRTSDLKAVLSVPIFEKQGDRWECVGVINLDSVTDKGADLLAENQDALIAHFTSVGMGLAKLRT